MREKNNNIALYAAVKTLHKEGHDMWSAVASLTLLAIKESCTVEEISEEFKKKYQLDIPTDVLKTIITRLTRNNFVEGGHYAVRLKPEGLKEKTKLEESVKNVLREYNALYEDFQSFLKRQGVKNFSAVNTAILDFIDDNIGVAADLVTANKNTQSSVPASAVADYIIHIEKNNPSLFELLQNIFFGRLYLTLIKTRTELDANANFDRLIVYLDTNIILSLLNLKDELLCKSAKELLNVLKGYKGSINIKMFDITVAETLSVLKSYATSKTGFTTNLKVDSIHYKMRLRKMDIQDLRLMIETLPEKIEKLGIEIVKEPEIKESRIQAASSELSVASTMLKQDKTVNAVYHDAIVTESIKQIRGTSRTRLLEKCKAIFVTQDKSVYFYASETAQGESTFPIAIRPVDIISLLWIKMLGSDKETSNGNLLRHAVMGYARERLINNQLWEKFLAKLEEARSRGDISPEDIGLILASDETEKLLTTNNENAVGKIVNQGYVDKLRRERKTLQEKSSQASKSAEILSASLTQSSEELEVVRKTASKLKEKEQKKAGIIHRQKELISKISHRISVVVSVIVWLIVVSIIFASLYCGLIIIGIDATASVIGIIAVVMIFLTTIVTGKTYKLGEVIRTIRLRVYISVKNKVEKLFIKMLFGQQPTD